jgi:hypothetical protein
MLGLAAMLLLAAVATARPGAPGERDAGPAVAARAAGPAPARTAYAFARPAGWRDATRAHAARFPGARPDVVLVGPASAGANLSVVRSVAGPDRPALEGIPGAALRRLHAADARQVGRSRWLTVAGEPAVAADYLLARGRFRARQVACYHQGDLYLVTLTAEEGAFASQARVQDRVLRSWRWT